MVHLQTRSRQFPMNEAGELSTFSKCSVSVSSLHRESNFPDLDKVHGRLTGLSLSKTTGSSLIVGPNKYSSVARSL